MFKNRKNRKKEYKRRTAAFLAAVLAVSTAIMQVPGAVDGGKEKSVVLDIGPERTAAQALFEVTAEEIEAADGNVVLQLVGDTADTDDIFLPTDKGIRHVTLTSVGAADYKLGSTPVSLFANGIPFLMEHGEVCNLFGGGRDIRLESTDLTVRGGTFYGAPGPTEGLIVGGSLAETEGADVSVEKTCKVLIEGGKNLKISNIYGGCFTDAGNVIANVGKTELTVRDSTLAVCVITGGSYIWGAPTGNVTLNLDSSNILIENSELDVGYMDFTFSIYGGHMGNDEVKNEVLNCGATNITVIGSKINPDDGGEIFGGHYNTDTTGSDVVTLGKSTINLKDSSVNGVFGGGYYVGYGNPETGEVEITLDQCEVKPSGLFEENICLIDGGDLKGYLRNQEDDGTARPYVGAAAINLKGPVTSNSSDGSETLLWAEGLNDAPSGLSPLFPQESHLTFAERAFDSAAAINYDSGWSDVALRAESGRKALIRNDEEYADLQKKVDAGIARLGILDQIKVETGSGISKIDSSAVELPENPENSWFTDAEWREFKLPVIASASDAVLSPFRKERPAGLALAVGDIDLEDPKNIEEISVSLHAAMRELTLEALGAGEDFAMVPKEFMLEAVPCAAVRYLDGTEKEIEILPENLSGKQVGFSVGLPEAVTAEHADIVHVKSDGTRETYTVDVEQTQDGKSLKLHAKEFGKFTVKLENIRKGSSGGGEPSDPTEPTEPSEPTDPSDPSDPSEPTDPADPSKPTKPTDPSEPTEPSEPTKPSEPTDPSEPTEPSEPTDPTDPAEKLRSILIDPDELTLEIGESQMLVLVASPSDAMPETVRWSSDKPETASVSEDGEITAKKAGKAAITAKAGGKTAVCRVTVEENLDEYQIVLAEDELSLTVGKLQPISYEILPSPEGVTLKWESSDSAVASVDGKGFVNAKKAGTATVRAFLAENGAQAECQITVEEPERVKTDDVRDILKSEEIKKVLESADGEGLTVEDVRAAADVLMGQLPEFGGSEQLANSQSALELLISKAEILEDRIMALDGMLGQTEVQTEDGVADLFRGDLEELCEVHGAALNLFAKKDAEEYGGATLECSLPDTPAVLPEKVGNRKLSAKDAVSLDLKLRDQRGDEMEALTLPVKIVLPLPKQFGSNDRIFVLHYPGDGSIDVLPAQIVKGRLEFYTMDFSTYVIARAESRIVPVTPRETEDSDNRAVEGTWVKDQAGWRYQKKDRTFLADIWENLPYKNQYEWYYFDEKGYMKTGWMKQGESWYFFNREPDGTLGRLATGWNQIDGTWYYFEPSAAKGLGRLREDRTRLN